MGLHEDDEFTDDVRQRQRQEIADILMATFGTPDDPDQPFGPDSESFLTRAGFDVRLLKTAAGAVHSTEDGQNFGLYRKHCVHCHGLTGDGRGPTAAFLNPYPRDYRHAQFKFKSTFGPGVKPTRDDLKLVLMEGIPGTSMPSFRLLPDSDLEAMIEYVKYLSVRGETETLLLQGYALDGDFAGMDSLEELVGAVAGGLPLQIEDGEAEEPEDEHMIASVMYSWFDAKNQVITAADMPAIANPNHPGHAESIGIGRRLFYGKAECVSCHGVSAQGDGQASDFNRRFQWRSKLKGQSQEKIDEVVAQFRHDGALAPRNARPRNLRHGIFRGGRRPIDIYYRIYSGINGTPMPGLGASPDANDFDEEANAVAAPEAKKVSPTDLWHLVSYVKSLHLEPLSRPTRPVEVQAVSVESNAGRLESHLHEAAK